MSILRSWRRPEPASRLERRGQAHDDRYRIVIIDNYDSYCYNLYQRIGELTGAEAIVFRNDVVTLDALKRYEPTHVVISPGPGTPDKAGYFGICRDVILDLGKTTPLLGVCLGHQGIVTAFGGRVVRAARVMHGKTSLVEHDKSALYRDVDSPFTAMRYHSLVVDRQSLPAELRVTASTDDGVVMGVAHRELPIHGVQFHPESIGTPLGVRVLGNFLELG